MKHIPVYQGGDKHLFSNHRTVSLLSQFFKVLEKLFFDSFIEKYRLLTHCQCEFRADTVGPPQWMSNYAPSIISILNRWQEWFET